MQRDIRDSDLYREAKALIEAVRRPGDGQISDAGEIHSSPDGRQAVFAGVIVNELAGGLPTRICKIDLQSGEIEVLSAGPNTDRSPKFSPDGRQVAFLSDRHEAGNFQLYLLDPASGATRSAPRVNGWIEYLQWSPDGRRILLGVAGHGSDTSTAQGAVTSRTAPEELPSWMPLIATGDDSSRWRHAWVYDCATNTVSDVCKAGINVWEASWCGDDALVAVVSPSPGEGLWYSASLHIVDVRTGRSREIYKSRDQLGLPSASPSGERIAVVEAVASDRGIVAGDLVLIERDCARATAVDTHGVDVAYVEWCSDRHVLIAGHRGFETVVGVYDHSSGQFIETWMSRQITTGMMGSVYARVASLAEPGDCVLIAESFVQAPAVAVVRNGKYTAVKSLHSSDAGLRNLVRSIERVSWPAPDGMDIQGWLLRPDAPGPRPLVMVVHGGPVFHFRPTWLGRGSPAALMMLRRGCAVFMPNPRGSSGRGRDFARQVLGDMGGADTYDLLSGIDHLVDAGMADASRLGVMGLSYGGFMTSWLITQDQRFAAAVPVGAVTNQVSHHLISNIPHFVELFLADTFTNPNGKYFQRSPIMHAHKVRTPTLNVCGALDRCTPAEEAIQFHSALLQNGIESVLVTYPEEGHGIRGFPATIDYAARVVGWFERHLIHGSMP